MICCVTHWCYAIQVKESKKKIYVATALVITVKPLTNTSLEEWYHGLLFSFWPCLKCAWGHYLVKK